ncbi:MAG: SPOR domain-containing protein [Gemmatimonadota bacterium]
MSPKAAALLALALTAACSRSGPAPESQRDTLFGDELVVGSSAERWSIASIPRAGGFLSLHSLETPADTIWVGATELPPTREAHTVAGGHMALVNTAGEAMFYNPAAEALDSLGPVGDGAVWTTNGEYGLFTDVEAGSALLVSVGSARRFALPAGVVWAAPVDANRIGVLVRSADATALLLLVAGEEEQSEQVAADITGPGIVTAWGRRLVFAAGTESSPVVRIYSSQTLEETSSIPMGSPVTALRSSPSSHVMYAALQGPSRVVAVNRFSLSERELGRTAGAVRDLRSSLFGGSVLAFDGQTIYRMVPEQGEPAVVSGDWRDDLPIGHMRDRVMIARGEAVVDLDILTGQATPVGSADAVWLALRWRPQAVPNFSQVAQAEATDSEAPAGAAPPVPGGTPRPGAEDVGAARRVAPGYYAIVGSANQEEGIADLVRSLAGAGFPTAVQQFADDAEQLWYRGLVGPFATRSGAEAAARQLVRERQLQTWVTRVERSPGSQGSI